MFSQFGLKELNVIQPHHCVQIVLVGVCQLNCACCFVLFCFVRITLLSVMFLFVCLFVFLFCYFIVSCMLGPRKRDGSSQGVYHNE